MSKAFLGSERLRLTSPQPEVVFLFRISQPKPGTDSGEEIKVCPHIPEGKFSQVSHVFFLTTTKVIFHSHFCQRTQPWKWLQDADRLTDVLASSDRQKRAALQANTSRSICYLFIVIYQSQVYLIAVPRFTVLYQDSFTSSNKI